MDTNNYTFFAFMNRMKLIGRWNLMRSTVQEDLMQHAAQVAIYGQALGIIRNEFFGGNVNVDKICSLALYHDTAEVVSGDFPTTVKYYNTTMKDAYQEIESVINNRVLDSLPNELRGHYQEFLMPDENTIEYKIMKVADKLAAYIKCVEEKHLGNHEFDKAYERLTVVLDGLREEYKELGYFLDNFLDGFSECLDI